MDSSLKDEKQRIKDRFDDKALHNGYDDDVKEVEGGKDGATRKFLLFDQENELDERSRTFRERSAQKFQKKARSEKIKNAIKRLLIVMLIISAICLTIYLISRVFARRRLKTFALHGSIGDFESFQGLPEGMTPQELGAISLTNVFLNATDLIDSLKDCHNLQSIRLENVKVRGDWSSAVYLPALEEFVYAESLEKSASANVMYEMTEPRLKSLLFFRTQKQGEERPHRRARPEKEKRNTAEQFEDINLEKIWDLEPDVNVTLGGHTILIVNHTRHELVLPWLPYLNREGIIRHAGKDLRRLSCNRLRLNIDALPHKLTHLTLRDVKLYGGDFSDLVKKLNKLVQLRVSFQDLTQVDLNILPRRTLRDLTLSKAIITEPLSKKFKLEQFALISSSISTSVAIDLADSLQPEQVALAECNILDPSAGETSTLQSEYNAEQPPVVMLRQLMKQDELHAIHAYKYKGDLHAIEQFENTQTNSTSGDQPVTSFLLERNSDQTWEAGPLSWDEWSEYKHEITGFERFWQLNS